MRLQEIENLPFSETKSRREELTKAALGSPPESVADRYIRTLIDAKLRDEKLGEQGLTIKSLNAAVASAQQEASVQAEQFGKVQAHLAAQSAKHAEAEQRITELNTRVEELQTAVAEAEKLAQQRRAALADVMKFAGQLSSKVAPLLAAE